MGAPIVSSDLKIKKCLLVDGRSFNHSSPWGLFLMVNRTFMGYPYKLCSLNSATSTTDMGKNRINSATVSSFSMEDNHIASFEVGHDLGKARLLKLTEWFNRK